jgi:hypothetical protein
MPAAFEAAWREVAEEQAATDPDFKRAWDLAPGFPRRLQNLEGFWLS